MLLVESQDTSRTILVKRGKGERDKEEKKKRENEIPNQIGDPKNLGIQNPNALPCKLIDEIERDPVTGTSLTNESGE